MFFGSLRSLTRIPSLIIPAPRTLLSFPPNKARILQSRAGIHTQSPAFYTPPEINFHPYKIDAETFEIIYKETQNRSPLAKDILGRIDIGAMSVGAINEKTHGRIARTVEAIIMALHGVKNRQELMQKLYQTGPSMVSGAGEGGDPNDHLVHQIASARFGVHLDYIIDAFVLQFKAGQGAKPGEGGALSGLKVNDLIAFLRKATPWGDLYSPWAHHDQYSIEDFAQIVKDYSRANPYVRWSCKLTSEPDVATIAFGVAKAMGRSEQGARSNIVITGQGATGNASVFSKFHTSFPWLVGLNKTHKRFVEAGIRNDVTLTASGALAGNFFDAFLFGSDRIEVATLAVTGDGCVQARVCHNNTCPVGIATLDAELVAKNTSNALNIARVLWAAAELTAAEMEPYFDSVEQAIGRAHDILEPITDGYVTGHEKYLLKPKPRFISLGGLKNQTGPSYTERAVIESLRKGENKLVLEAKNCDLSFGGRIAYFTQKDPAITELVNTKGIQLHFKGLAPGQSFGVLGAKGMQLIATAPGYTNDGTGKSLSGGEIFTESCGNQAGFAMTEGFISTQRAASRAAVRQSGGVFITRKAGAFFANYHTRGRTLVLGFYHHYRDLNLGKDPLMQSNNDCAIGHTFLSGFSGGQIIMPELLWQETLKRNHVSATVRNTLKGQPLNGEDKKNLIKDLEKNVSTRDQYGIEDSLSKALLAAIQNDETLIDKWFIKLEAPTPKAQAKKTITLTAGQLTTAQETLPLPDIKIENSAKTSALPDKDNTNVVIGPDRDRPACGTGLIMNLDHQASHEIVQLGVAALQRSEHRGASGIDPLSGDGCGIAIYFNAQFFQTQFPHLSLEEGQFGVMSVFMPKDPQHFQITQQILQDSLRTFQLTAAGERIVPLDENYLGILAREDQLQLMQYIIVKNSEQTLKEFDRHLALAHLKFEFTAQQMEIPHKAHCSSASRRFVVYKTKGREKHLSDIYPDLKNSSFAAYLVLSHARFATNTATLIESVQPTSRVRLYNGEINNIRRFLVALKYNPQFSQLLGMDLSKVDFARYSDSVIMGYYMEMLQLLNYDDKQIHHAIFQPYSPQHDDAISHYHNLVGSSGLEGPNASIRVYESGDDFRVWIETDSMGLRPHRGIYDAEKRLLVTGSELGLVANLQGELYECGPGDALEINPVTGSCNFFHAEKKEQEKFFSLLKEVEKLDPSSDYKNPPIIFSAAELQERKLRAGITAEIENTFLKHMRTSHNKRATTSMGDDTAPEVTVSGTTRVINTIKTDFAQITRPSVDLVCEGEVLSTDLLIASKSSLENLYSTNPSGYQINNPILDNHQMQMLLTSKKFKSLLLDISYNVSEMHEGMQKRLAEVSELCIKAANEGVHVIVLSDIQADIQSQASIPPMIVAGVVDVELMKAGLRDKVILILQSAVAATPLEQITALSLGINCINPYLMFVPSALYETDRQAFIQECHHYQEAALLEIKAAMARAGIRTLNAGYVGTRLIKALGLDADIANRMGIYSELGGFDWANIALSVLDMHLRPSNLGKYLDNGQEARKGQWNVALVRAYLDIASGKKTIPESLPLLKQIIDEITKNFLEGQFRKKPPQKWSASNPMTVVIVGGGSAGFMQTQALLNSSIAHKIKIMILEENPANLLGLIKYGVAPDKQTTKKMQTQMLSACVKHPNVKYYGGIKVGKEGHVSFEELTKLYPCVIDCRGAPQDKRIANIPGNEFIINASDVWKAYNGYYDPFKPERYWPFNSYSRSEEKMVLGHGNVTADIIRMLLTKPSDLMDTDIHPTYLKQLEKKAPRVIHNLVRGSVLDSKISLKELESLIKNGIKVFAYFEDVENDKPLTEEQRLKLDFFQKAKINTPSLNDEKSAHFYFNYSPLEVVKDPGRHLLKVVAKHDNGNLKTFWVSDCISAIGREPAVENAETPYVAGWASGSGGNLQIIEETVARNTEKILQDDAKRLFDHTVNPASEQPWQLMASVTNQGFLNILRWREEEKPLDTVHDFHQARDYYPVTQTAEKINEVKEITVDEKESRQKISINNNQLGIFDAKKKTTITLDLEGKKDKTVYHVLKEAAQDNPELPNPNDECGGKGTCMACRGEVTTSDSSKEVKKTEPEKLRLHTLFGKKAKNMVLTCQQPVENLAGATVEILDPKPPGKKM